jgi:3-dehydroquinate synthase II
MKDLIIDARPYNKEIITTAIERGVTKVIVEKGKTNEVHKLGKIKTIAEDGDLNPEKDYLEIELKNKDDEEQIVKESKEKIVVVKTDSWKIIPLENLVSKSDNIYANVSLKDLTAVLGVLEKGVRGIVFKPKNSLEVIEVASKLKENSDSVELVQAEITNVKNLSSGDRACVDTGSLMVVGEGMLVGNSSSFLFLVNSESVESEYCDTRPFRVNAGSIHSYVLMPNNKTKYLSEIKSGDEVLIINEKGKAKTAYVGRNKIEERPMILVEAKVGNKVNSVVLQNAETIRLVSDNKKVISVTDLKKGDKVLVRVEEGAARHFGVAIKEKIKE